MCVVLTISDHIRKQIRKLNSKLLVLDSSITDGLILLVYAPPHSLIHQIYVTDQTIFTKIKTHINGSRIVYTSENDFGFDHAHPQYFEQVQKHLEQSFPKPVKNASDNRRYRVRPKSNYPTPKRRKTTKMS